MAVIIAALASLDCKINPALRRTGFLSRLNLFTYI